MVPARVFSGKPDCKVLQNFFARLSRKVFAQGFCIRFLHKVFAAAQAELSALNTCGVLRKLKIEFAAHRPAYCHFLRGTGRCARKRSFGLIAAIGRGARESRSSIFCLRLFSFARFVRSDIRRFPTLRFSSRGGSCLASSASRLLRRVCRQSPLPEFPPWARRGRRWGRLRLGLSKKRNSFLRLLELVSRFPLLFGFFFARIRTAVFLRELDFLKPL